MINNILLTICARGGSKGVKGKNIRLLNRIPLIAYTILQAKEWGKAKHIIVSTDSIEIAKIAKKYGAEVPFLRPHELALDNSPKLPVIKHALLKTEKKYQIKFDAVLDLDPTSPVRNAVDIENCLNIFFSKNPKTVFSVTPARKNPYFNMVEIDKNGKAHYSKKTKLNLSRRQDAPKVYDMNASIYVYQRDYLLSDAIFPVSNNSIAYIMSDVSEVDIDREIDFKYLEFLIKEKVVSI